MVESVADVIEDLFPPYVSDMILNIVLPLNKEELNAEVRSVGSDWLPFMSKRTFGLRHNVYIKCGVLANTISRALNRGERHSNLIMYDAEGEKYPGSKEKTDIITCEFPRQAIFYRLTKKTLIHYLSENGVSVKGGLKSKKYLELVKLTMTF